MDALIEKFNIADAGSLNWRLYEWKELSHFDIEGQNDGRGRNNRRGRQVPEQVRAVPRYVHFSVSCIETQKASYTHFY